MKKNVSDFFKLIFLLAIMMTLFIISTFVIKNRVRKTEIKKENTNIQLVQDVKKIFCEAFMNQDVLEDFQNRLEYNDKIDIYIGSTDGVSYSEIKKKYDVLYSYMNDVDNTEGRKFYKIEKYNWAGLYFTVYKDLSFEVKLSLNQRDPIQCLYADDKFCR